MSLAEHGGPELTIDDLVERTGVVPDIITIDIEGAEVNALRGCLKTIELYKPTFVLSVHPEFIFHGYGTYERELHDILRSRGYKGTWLDYDHEHHWLYEYTGQWGGGYENWDERNTMPV